MKLRPLLFGAAVGFICSYTLKNFFLQKINMTPEKVLTLVRGSFKNEGPIQGSWIQMEVKPYKNTQVYRGGITKLNEGASEIYEFTADASTGNILEIHQITIKNS